MIFRNSASLNVEADCPELGTHTRVVLQFANTDTIVDGLIEPHWMILALCIFSAWSTHKRNDFCFCHACCDGLKCRRS